MAGGTAVIVGAIIAALGSGIAGGISSSDAEKARREGSRLAMIRRQDELAVRKSQERMERLRLRQQKKQAEMQAEAEKARLKQHKKEFASQERDSYFNKQMGMLNSSENMRNNFANALKRRAA